MLLSIGMMVRNEQKYLERCLQNLQPILASLDSELIIVDTGSSDNTVEIAKRYTEQVYFHEWTNDFGEMRNTVLSYAKGEWFFFVDADEIIDDHADIIRFFRSRRHKKANAAFFLLKNILFLDDDDSYMYTHVLRFFRNDKSFRFQGAIHEQPIYRGPVAQIRASAIHYGYINDDAELMEYKYRRNLEIIKTELEQDPENIYYWFQLSQCYGMYKDNRKSLEAIQKAYDIMTAKEKSEYRMFVFTNLAKNCLANKMYRKVIKICDEGCALKDGYFDLYYYRGVSHLELGNYEDALSSLLMYLRAVEKFNQGEGLIDLSVSYQTPGLYENALQQISVIYNRLEQYDLALEYANRITDKAVYQGVIPHVVAIYMEQERFLELRSLYQKKVAEYPELDEAFLAVFEQQRLTMPPDQKEMWGELFVDDRNDYGLLNRIRVLDKAGGYVSDELEAEIEALDFQELQLFYADILRIWIRRGRSIIPLIQDVTDGKLNGFLMHLAKSQRDYGTVLVDHLQEKGLWSSGDLEPDILRIQVLLLRSILVVDGLSDDIYESVFQIYVHSGSENLRNVYHPDVIDKEKVAFMKTDPDAFLLYMLKAYGCHESDKAQYARYLRLALQRDIEMKKGIEILQKRLSDSLEEPKRELEAHKQKVLQTIEGCINMGDLENAKVLIAEYEDIVGLDVEICSAKAIILIVEQRLDEAKAVLLEGLKLDSSNVDLLYNMGYLCESVNEYDQALRYYHAAEECCPTEELLSDLRANQQRIKKHLKRV